MLFFANPCGQKALRAMADGLLGYIDTPAQGNTRPRGLIWCADNGCYGSGWPGYERWFRWLNDNVVDAETCRFAVAPDVVGDARGTLERSLPWLQKIRDLCYPAALVAQDGLEYLDVPWDAFDVLFVGGSTGWKLGREARQIVLEAKSRDKYVHMGRVNSARRWRYAEAIGCDSADGTYLIYGPEVNLAKLLAWTSPGLFTE